MCINYLLSVALFKILNDVIICTLLDSGNKILIEKVYVLIHMYNSQCNWTYGAKGSGRPGPFRIISLRAQPRRKTFEDN